MIFFLFRFENNEEEQLLLAVDSARDCRDRIVLFETRFQQQTVYFRTCRSTVKLGRLFSKNPNGDGCLYSLSSYSVTC